MCSYEGHHCVEQAPMFWSPNKPREQYLSHDGPRSTGKSCCVPVLAANQRSRLRLEAAVGGRNDGAGGDRGHHEPCPCHGNRNVGNQRHAAISMINFTELSFPEVSVPSQRPCSAGDMSLRSVRFLLQSPPRPRYPLSHHRVTLARRWRGGTGGGRRPRTAV